MNRFCAFLACGILMGCALETRAAGVPSSSALIQKLNARYDDFFHHLRKQQEWDQRRDMGRNKVTELREAHQEKLEHAREEYVQSRHTRPDNKAAYQAWLAEDAAWKEKLQIARRKQVERRDLIEDLRRRGRAIPPMKEYDLEDY